MIKKIYLSEREVAVLNGLVSCSLITTINIAFYEKREDETYSLKELIKILEDIQKMLK